MLGAVIRNTPTRPCSRPATRSNVIPGEATAHVDGRFLPGYEDEFFDTLRELLPDDVELELLVHDTGAGDAVRRRHWSTR